MIRFVFTALSILMLSGCSTVLDKSYQTVTIETPGAQDALCTLENRDFKYKVRAPKTLTITKSTKPLNVRCIAPGNREKTIIVKPQTTDNIFLNLGTGLLPGLAVDYETASMFEFPSVISVDFTDVPAKRMPLPAYQQLLNDNPMLMELEEFRPGRSALQRDRYEAIPTLQKADRQAQQWDGWSDNSVTDSPVVQTYESHDKAPVSGYSGETSLPPSLNPGISSGTQQPASLIPSY